MSRIERRKQERLDEVRRFAKESDIPVHNMELLNVALTHTSYANAVSYTHLTLPTT